MEAKVIADDNLTDDDGTSQTFTVTAKIAETEAEDREALDAHTVVVTVDDDDEVPDQPGLVVTGVAGGLNLAITEPGRWGSAAAASRSYQYRYKITSASDDAAWSTWTPVAATATSAEIRNLINGVSYTVELKAVTAAGESTVATDDEAAGAQ